MYEGALRVLADSAVAQVPGATYSGVLVDEYQDCTKQQHLVIAALADLIPTRVLGDPLQGIFDFGGNIPVDWESDIEGVFGALPPLDEPWRWRSGSLELGEWLGGVRSELLRGASIDLRDAPAGVVEWIRITQSNRSDRQIATCFRMLNEDTGLLAAIHNMPNQCRYLASRLRGKYQCAEANECPDLLDYTACIECATGVERAAAVVELVCSCVSGLKGELTSVRERLHQGNVPDPSRYRANRPVIEAVACVCMSDRLECVQHLVDELLEIRGCFGYRWEPLRDFQRGLRMMLKEEAESLADAVWSIRDRFRRTGRPIPRRVLGTTKLLKGLEFDTVVVLDAEALSRKDLYVALTRASTRLVVLSESSVLSPDR